MNKLILRSDSYKSSHWLQYPPGTDGMFCYFESRGGRFPYTVFFGLQYIIKKYLSQPITALDVEYAERRIIKHGLPFNKEGWMRVVERHRGYVPLLIRAVPEGTVVPTHNALMTVESTDPELFWLVGYFETLLERVWYPTTVATLSHEIRRVIYSSLAETSDDPDSEIGFKLHDFGARGSTTAESAALGDCAHLVNFMGTDTMEGLELAYEYYHEEMAGFSIPAAEHSTITSWGRENEAAAMENMLDRFAGPGKLVAVVSDSYDLWNAVDNIWGRQLRDKVVASGGTVVVRPDSGDPVQVVLETLRRLDASYGHTVNSKGFKVLNNVRVIRGDGICLESVQAILSAINSAGYSTTNLAFGSGGALIQKVDRDTQKMAYKCSSVSVSGRDRDVYKDPVTDPGKRSKAGRLDLVRSDGLFGFDSYSTVRIVGGESDNTVMMDYYHDGVVLADQRLSDIRQRARMAF